MKKVERKKNQKGFSLVELIIVIAILGIIAAIAVPNVMASLEDARKNSDYTNARAIASAVVLLEAQKDSGVAGSGSGLVAGTAETVDNLGNVQDQLSGATPVTKATWTGAAAGSQFEVTLGTDGSVKVTPEGSSEVLYPTT